MKVLIVCAFIAVVRGTALYGSPVVTGVINTGASTVHRSQDTLGQYSFGYDETHSSGGTFRKEVGDAHGNKVGSYGLTDIDGRQRIVNYIADGAGFRANIRSNEQGVGGTAQDPAHTNINKDFTILAAAPAPIAISAPAAVAISAPSAPASVVAAPIAAAEEDFELAQAVDSPLPYAAGVVATKAVASPLHYAAGNVVTTKSFATHVSAPLHYAATPLHYGAARVHYGATHGVAAPLHYSAAHGVAAPLHYGAAHGVAHYSAGIAPISTHITHHSAAPVSYSTSVNHYAHGSAFPYAHPAINSYVY